MSDYGKLTSTHKFTFGGNTNSQIGNQDEDDLEFGIRAFQSGDFERAAASAKRAIKKDPNNAEAHSLLGGIAEQLGELEQAAGHYGDALQVDASHFKSLYSLGVLYFNVGHPAQAVDLLSRAVVSNPKFTDAKWALARAYSSLGRFDEADVLFQALVAASPNDAHLLHNYAQNHIENGNIEAAFDVLDRALAQKSDSPLLQNLKAIALQYAGDFEAAEPLLRQSLANNGPQANAYMALVTAKAMNAQDASDAEKLLSDPQQPTSEIIGLNLALGQYCEQNNQSEAAAKHYQTALNINGVDTEHNTADIEEGLGLHKSLAEDGFFNNGQTGHPSALPIFISGLPRSGITLVEQIIAGHSDVWSGGEKDFLMPRIDEIETLENAYPQAAHDIDSEKLVAIGADYLGSFPYDALDAERITNRAPTNAPYQALIRKVFPNATLINVRRHPLDIVLSTIANLHVLRGTYLKDIESIAHFVDQNIKAIDHISANIPAPALNVYYEDLVNNFDATAKTIIAHTGLEWNDDCANFYARERAEKSPTPYAIRQPIFASSVGRHKQFADLLAPATTILKDEIEKYEAR